MTNAVPESLYPLRFQEKDAAKLGGYLSQRQCINLIGMKRVGISNFLRFFLTHKDIAPTYLEKTQQHVFITVDLNDLVEREIYPFWTLTFKRIIDACEEAKLPSATRTKIVALFDKSIQQHELFLVIDNIRQALSIIVDKGIYPTIFFLRFDRLQDKFNPSFFHNLEGLRDATNGNLAYVFTSDRSLLSLFPSVRTSLSVFAQRMYMKPLGEQDMRVIYEAYRERYHFILSPEAEKALFSVVHGYVQYLQLSLIVLNEKKDEKFATELDILKILLADERITLQSEELWESLTKDEKKILLYIVRRQKIAALDKEKSMYLWETGIVMEESGVLRIFSPLFERFLRDIEEAEHRRNRVVHLTRKENLLFNLLKSQVGEICEREKIIEAVWPEYQEFGVSDWAIDRLVARVRVKLREQDSPYEVVTVRTRGYKLTSVKE